MSIEPGTYLIHPSGPRSYDFVGLALGPPVIPPRPAPLIIVEEQRKAEFVVKPAHADSYELTTQIIPAFEATIVHDQDQDQIVLAKLLEPGTQPQSWRIELNRSTGTYRITIPNTNACWTRSGDDSGIIRLKPVADEQAPNQSWNLTRLN